MVEGFHPSLEGLCEDLYLEEQILSQQTDSADAVRTPSTSSEEACATGLGQARTWWAKLLQQHLPLPDTVNGPFRPITIVSGCTGAASEISVFKAGKLVS